LPGKNLLAFPHSLDRLLNCGCGAFQATLLAAYSLAVLPSLLVAELSGIRISGVSAINGMHKLMLPQKYFERQVTRSTPAKRPLCG
jgi:hypothetical protein